MDLRDQFAAQFGAALAGAFQDPAQIAKRAYDFADAMLAERARRIDEDEAAAIALEARDAEVRGDHDDASGVDEAWDAELESRGLEAQHDPSWDLDPRWNEDDDRVGPGLSRTRPIAAARKERSA